MQPGSLRLVLGHQRPQFALWPGHRFVVFSDPQEGDFILPPPPPELADLGDDLCSEYRYLFCLRRLLELDESIESVTISHHRRLVTRVPVGEIALNQPYARVISAEQASRLTSAELPAATDTGWLISTLFTVQPNVTVHYAMHHPLRDLMRFLSDAIDAGVLSSDEALAASQAGVMIPAATAGVFPADAFIRHMTQLEDCALAFRHGGWRRNPGYQIRSIGFCLERLHSYLILNELRATGLDPQASSGFQTVIGESRTIGGSIPGTAEVRV